MSATLLDAVGITRQDLRSTFVPGLGSE